VTFVPFYFDGNQWWGVVDSLTKWYDLLGAYSIEDVLSAASADQGVRDHGRTMPSFGYRIEHSIGKVTLGEWALSQGMNLRHMVDVGVRRSEAG
jgi:hypothetical protein